MMNLDDNMAKIKELSQLLNIPFDERFYKKGSEIDYKVESGGCKGVGLFKNNKIAVAYAEWQPNTIFPAHEHEHEREILIVFEGDLTTISGENSISVVNSGILISEIGVLHINKSLKGCKTISITIPASEGYPNVK